MPNEYESLKCCLQIFFKYTLKLEIEEECIPVGCILPILVTAARCQYWAMYRIPPFLIPYPYPWDHNPSRPYPQKEHETRQEVTSYPPPPTPQLRWRAVIMWLAAWDMTCCRPKANNGPCYSSVQCFEHLLCELLKGVKTIVCKCIHC